MDNPAFIPDSATDVKQDSNKSTTNGHLKTGKVQPAERLQKKDITLDLSLSKDPQRPEIQLRQSIGLPSAIGLAICNVVGSGIFISPQGVLRGSGSVALSLIIWALCGIISLFGALTYAELGTLINDSGGTYIYLLEGFSPDRKKTGSTWRVIPAFLYNWQYTFFAYPASMAIVSLSCGEYLIRLSNTNGISCPQYDSNHLSVKLIAAAILCIVAAMNCYSVKLSTYVQNISAVLKILAIMIVILCGFWKWIDVPAARATLATGFQDTNKNYGEIASAFYSGLWAFNGWQCLNNVTKEMKHSERDLPRALIPANLLVALCYVLVNVSYLLVLTKRELLQSETVAVGFGYRIGGEVGEIIMILFVAVTAFGSAASGCFSSGRLCHVAAREGHMMEVFSYIHKDYLTPTSAILFNLIVSLIMIIPSDIASLITLSGFTTWIFIGATQVSLLVMRKTRKYHDRAVKVNILVPVIVLLFSIFLVVTPILDCPSLSYFYVLAFIAIGIFVYIPFVHFQMVLPRVDYFTHVIQYILKVVPQTKSPFET